MFLDKQVVVNVISYPVIARSFLNSEIVFCVGRHPGTVQTFREDMLRNWLRWPGYQDLTVGYATLRWIRPYSIYGISPITDIYIDQDKLRWCRFLNAEVL